MPPDTDQKVARRYLEMVMQATGLDLTNIARKSGISPTTLTRFYNAEDVKHTLSARTLAKLHDGTGVPFPAPLSSVMAQKRIVTDNTGAARSTILRLPFREARRDSPDLPLRGRPDIHGGSIMLDMVTTSWIDRPWFLDGVEDAYATYMAGSEMEPIFRNGDLLYANPGRPPAIGDDVIIEMSDGSGVVRRLAARAPDAVIVRKFNPLSEDKMLLASIKAIHFIVAVYRP